MKMQRLLKLMGLYPPYLGAGVSVKSISDDFSKLTVEMKLRFWNKNYVGTQFGGSLYSMVDPFYMLMLIQRLGKEYIVWDKAAAIDFKKPGRGKVYASFELTDAKVNELKKELEQKDKVLPIFDVEIRDSESDEIVATVKKTLYIRKK